MCYWIVKSLNEIYEIVDASFDVPVMLSITKKLKLYPLNLIFCWTGISIFRIIDIAGVDGGDVYLGISVALWGIHGLINAILYGSNPHV